MFLRKFFGSIAILACAFLFLLKKDECVSGISEALSMCGEVLIPSLFPFAVLSYIATNSDFFNVNNVKIQSAFRKLTRLPVCCLPAIIFGFTGGYPVGLSVAADLYENGKISKVQAKRLMSFCVNAGPSFTVTAVGGLIFGSKTAGILLFAAVSIASLVMAFFTRFIYKDIGSQIHNKTQRNDSVLCSAVSSSVSKTAVMCGWVVLFSALNSIVLSFIENEKIRLFLYSVSEVSNGVKSAARLGGLPFAAFCVSFGGLCVMCQLLPQIKKCGCKVSEYLAFRIINGIIAYFTAEILLKAFDIAVSVAAFESYTVWSYSAPASAMLIVMGAVFVFDMASGKPQKMNFSDLTGA